MGRLADIRWGTVAIIATGTGLFFAAVTHHISEIDRLRTLKGPLAALVLDGIPALGLVYAGYWLDGTDLDARSVCRVALWCLLGGAIFVITIDLSMFIRLAEGRPVAEPIFVLLLTAEVGTLAGFVAGYYRVRALKGKREAERAAEGLSFVNSIVRHDLRNDLQVIDASAELMRTGDGATETVVDRAETIRESAANARERLEDTEAIAKTLNQDAPLEAVDLVAVVSEVATHVEDLYGVPVETDLPETAHATGNQGLRSVVDNLLENAVEHNDSDDPHVVVAVERDDETVRLVVSDNGPGLPESAKAALSGSDVDGTVGGLRIVRQLVSEYGGDISVSDNEPRGTTIAVYLRSGKPRGVSQSRA
ncbi:MAG: ATP-binding protein [Haloarculaceae archaeon]